MKLKERIGAKDTAPEATPAPARKAAAAKLNKTPVAKAREGKKAIIGYFTPQLSDTLAILAIEQGSTMQGMMGEALDLLFKKYGKPQFEER